MQASRAVRARARIARDAGRRVVPRRAPQLRGARLPGAATAASRRGQARLRAPSARRDDLGRPPRADATLRGGASRDRVSARRPRRRLPAEHRRGGRRLPRVRQPRRDLVELLARLRGSGASSTGSPRSSRASCSRSTATATAAVTTTGSRSCGRCSRRCPRSSGRSCSATSIPEPSLTGLTGRHELGRLRRGGRRRAALVRAGAVRPPAVGALQLRHHRPAQGDRARARRDPARAPQGAHLPRRRPGGRPPLLVHDDGLDDVELPERRAAHAGIDRALRRQPGPSRSRDALGSRRAGGRHVLRHVGELHRRVHEGRESRHARDAISPGSTRSARPAPRSSPEGFDWVYDRLGPDVWLFSTSGGTDLCTAFVGGVPTLPVYRGELQARALGAKVEAWSADGGPVIGEVGELVITEPMPSMPIRLWGDDGRRALPGELLRHVPRRLAPRRLDRDHRPRHGDHHRSLRRDDQPRRDPDGDGGDLPRRARARRGRRRARRRPPARGDAGVHAALRRAATRRRAGRRRSSRGSGREFARTAPHDTCPTRSAPCRRCRERCRGRCSRCP